MRYYPAFLDLRGRYCLVVGAGAVGRRKISGLLRSEPKHILILDTSPADEKLQAMLEKYRGLTRFHFEQREFTPEDLNRFGRCALVFAATGSRESNGLIATCCAESGILCNCVDAPGSGSFLVPAVVERGTMTVALSTGGGSPALARRIREDLEVWMGERFDGMVEFMTRLRPLVLAMQRETGQNTELFRKVTDSGLIEALRQRDRALCETLLRELLPCEIHTSIGELLHDLA